MTQAITNISADVLKVHPRNTEFFDDISGEDYDRFKQSIADDGLLSPLIVAPDMTVISGHQRLKACKELGYKTVPVIIKDDLEDEDEKLKKLIAANFGRLKNDPIKQKTLIFEYERLCGVTHGGDRKSKPNCSVLNQAEVAKRFGVSVDTIQNIKALDKLLPVFQDAVSQGMITATTGFKVLAKLSEEEQLTLLEKLPSAQKFTQAQMQQYIDQIKGLEREKRELQEVAVDAVKVAECAAKASEDSEEYLRIIKEKEEIDEERRKYYEKWKEEKNKDKGLSADEVQKKVDEAVAKTKQEYRKLVDAKEKTIAGLQEQEPKTVEVEVEVLPEDYKQTKQELAELKEEFERLRKEASRKASHEPQIRVVDSDTSKEELAMIYFNDIQNSSGTFLAEMEGLALSKELCNYLPSKERAALAENFRLLASRAEEMLGYIWKTNKEIVA